MSALNMVALCIGWTVLLVAFVAAIAAAWWGLGELIWRAIPESWRAAQKFTVPQSRYGDYIPPGISRKALALLLLLGGPYGWLRYPRLVQHNRLKRAIATQQHNQDRQPHQEGAR